MFDGEKWLAGCSFQLTKQVIRTGVSFKPHCGLCRVMEGEGPPNDSPAWQRACGGMHGLNWWHAKLSG